jgi:hypothetical protein
MIWSLEKAKNEKKSVITRNYEMSTPYHASPTDYKKTLKDDMSG